MLGRAFVFFLLQVSALGSRINVRAQLVETHAKEKQGVDFAGGDDTAWTLQFSGVPCHLSDDLKQLGPFASGIQGNWNIKDLAGTITKEGRKLASDGNCKLCNIEVQGSILPFKLGDIKPQISAVVTCAAESDKLSIGCFRGQGNLGKFDPESKRGVCTPCPEECDSGCSVPGSLDFGYSSDVWFKCRTNDPKKIAGAATKGSDTIANIASGYECEGTKYKKLKKEAQEILGEADSNDFKPTFYKSKKEGMWNLYCKYKDFAAGVDEETRSPLVADDSTWAFNAGITGCSNVRDVSQDGFIANLAKAASPKLQAQAENQNCKICESSFGGLVDTLVKDIDPSSLLKDMSGEELKGGESLWMKADCAVEQLGTAACSVNKGSVGWAENAPCLPCPEECMSCHVDKSQLKQKKFKCALKPIVSFPSPALSSMTGASNAGGDALEEDLYKLPEGLTCAKPEPRACSKVKKGDWCKVWQFKTVCDFGQFGNPDEV